jgi:hypothetical protein
MKKYISYFIILLSALLLACACDQKENGQEEQPVAQLTGIYYVGVDETEEMELSAGRARTVLVRALADSAEVSDLILKITFKADPDAVAKYNKAKGTSYVMCPGSAYEFTAPEAMMPKYGRSSTSAKLKLSGASLEDGITYILPLTIDKVSGTDKWELKEDPQAYLIFKKAYVAPNAGSGTKEDPYNLYTAQDLMGMRELLVEKKITYFRLQNDIDMSGIENWVPLNFASPYELGVDFDGNGHTISNFYCDYSSYPSFFGVLNGKCYDVTFTNAKVVVIDARSGILAGYCGLQDASKGIRGDCERVHIQGELDHTLSTKYGAGGFFGFMGTGSLHACSADVIINSRLNNVGGLCGYCGKVVEIVDCWTSGVITGGQRVGGIIGGTVGDDDPSIPIRIANCYTTATVHGSFGIGGIGGYFTMAKATPKDVDPGNIFENCIAWNDEIRANTPWNSEGTLGNPNPGDMSHYSCGAIVGWTAVRNTLRSCYRNPAMKYNENIFFDYSDAFSLYDQNDVSPASPLVVVEVAGANYNYPYHGKAAPSGKTVSQIAKGLGWSSSVWDFSGELPVLKGKSSSDEPEAPEPGGQLPDFDENEF